MTTLFKIFVLTFALSCFSLAPCVYGQEKPDQRAGEPAVEQQKVPAAREEAPTAVTGTATVGIYNKYIFRGYELSKRSMVIQPGLTVSYGGFSVSYWGNIDTKEHETQNFVPDRPRHKSFNETDLTLSYAYAIDKLALTGGYTYYNTKYVDETQELFVTVSYDMIGKPTLSIYRDVDAYPGTYFNVSLAHSVKVYGETTFDLGASAGYQWGDGNYWKTPSGRKYSAFHDGMVKAGFTIPVTKKVSIVPTIQYWFPLSGKAGKKDYNPNGRLERNVQGGIGINYNF
jgi:hypothetical protein